MKLEIAAKLQTVLRVALRGRAWIEILPIYLHDQPYGCRPPREGVD